MYKKSTRITAIIMSSLVLVLSLVFLPQASIQVKAAVPVIDISVISQDALKYICQDIIDNTDVLEKTYIQFNSLAEQASNVLNDVVEDATAVETELNKFINYIYPSITAQLSPTKFLSSVLVKMGYIATNVTTYTTKLVDYPVEVVRLGLELLNNGINPSKPDIVPDKVYTVSAETQQALKTVGDEALLADRNSIYTLVDSITYQELTDMIDDVFFPRVVTDYSQSQADTFIPRMKQAIQVMHDSTEEDSISVMAWRTNSSQLEYAYYFKDIIIKDYTFPDSANVDKVFIDNSDHFNSIAMVGASGMKTISTHSNSIYKDYILGNSMWNQKIFYFPYVTRDGRPVRLWASQSMYDKYYNWNNEAPYNIITTPQYETITQDTMQPFSIKGENIEKVNMGEIYNGIVNKVLEQNDYSDNSVQNIANDYSSTIINNYYITQTPGDTGSDSDNNNVDTGTDIVPSDTQCTEHVNGFLEEIDTMGELFPSIIEKMSVWKQIPSDIGNFVKDGLSWLPPECVALIVSGVAAMVGIGIWRIFRG